MARSMFQKLQIKLSLVTGYADEVQHSDSEGEGEGECATGTKFECETFGGPKVLQWGGVIKILK